jgi:hemerythrin-like domain-containing protein
VTAVTPRGESAGDNGSMIKLGDLLSGKPSHAGIEQPVEHLVACHRRIEERLETLVRAGEHFEQHFDEAAEAAAAAIRFLDTSGVLHTEDEEQSVFPRIRAHAVSDQSKEYLDALEADHRTADAVYSRFKQLLESIRAAGPGGITPAQMEEYRAGAARLRALYAEHIASEDRVLVDLAHDTLSAEDLAAITTEMRERRRS